MPKEEQRRLEELYDYKILDSPREEEFDELAELAAYVCKCPVASITFIEKDRQWFKSCFGHRSAETPRSLSFCTHTIEQDGVMTVRDARLDPRFRDNPNVTGGMGIVFYAGAPIVTASGNKLGAVCVVDHKERGLSREQEHMLQAIAAQVSRNLELRIKNKALAEQSHAVLSELTKGLRSYHDFFQNAPTAQWVFDPGTLGFIDVNRAALALYGYTRKEFMALSLEEINPSLHEPGYKKVIEHVQTRDDVISFSSRHRTKAGALLDVEVSISMVAFNGGTYKVSTVLDITDRVRLEKQLAQEQLDSQRKVMQAIIVSQEQEREYLGQELHDNVTQMLAASKLFLDLSIDHPEKESFIARAGSTIQQSIDEIRKLSKKLVAPMIKEEGLTAAIKEAIYPMHAAGKFKATVHCTPEADRLPHNLQVAIYRIVQEQLHNILKYADARNVVIKLTLDNQVNLTISDDGKGFDTKSQRKGIGLRNIQERIIAFNGSFQIISAPGKGCQLEISCPLAEVLDGFR